MGFRDSVSNETLLNVGLSTAVILGLGVLAWPEGAQKVKQLPPKVVDYILDDDGETRPITETQQIDTSMPCRPGEKVFAVETNQPHVAVTIDDGPSETTLANVEVARKYGASITFFFIADEIQRPENQAIVQAVLAEGHEIAAHSLSHDLRNPDVNAYEHNAANTMLSQVAGFVPYAYRAPGLNYSEALQNVVTESGQCFIDVSYGADTKDWQCDNEPNDVAINGKEMRIDNLTYQPGFIYLMHDELFSDKQGRSTSPDTLDYLLQSLNSRGLTSVTTAELLREGEIISSMPPDTRNSPC